MNNLVFWGGQMGHSKAAKAKTHKRIVAIASKRFREEGLGGVGIADLMKEAGVAAGRLYKPFPSRERLTAGGGRPALRSGRRQMGAPAPARSPSQPHATDPHP